MEATKLSGRQLGSSSIEKESCAVQTFRNKIQLPTGRFKKNPWWLGPFRELRFNICSRVEYVVHHVLSWQEKRSTTYFNLQGDDDREEACYTSSLVRCGLQRHNA
jgi:hypothetical protein